METDRDALISNENSISLMDFMVIAAYTFSQHWHSYSFNENASKYYHSQNS